MSKSLPTIALALLLLACEPITASVVEVVTRDGRVDAAHDARVKPPMGEPDDVKDTAVDLEPAEPDGCLVLVDQSIPEVVTDPAAVQGRFVQARTGKGAGCDDADAGPKFLQDSVFSRRDGRRMVERGKRYSYRWMTDTAMNRVRLLGGDQTCPEQNVVNFEHGAFQFAPLGFASCYEFVSPIDAHYVRTVAADYFDPLSWLALGKAPPELRLCPGECPAGTEHDFTTMDAGTPLLDASVTTPPVPSVP